MGEQASASTSPILELRGISKSFHGTKVLDGVDLAVRSGEVMALMGEGAGKSTLMKIVTGIYEADPGGTIRLNRTKSLHQPTSIDFCRHRQYDLSGLNLCES